MFAWFGALSLRWKLASVTILAGVMTMALTVVITGIYDARSYEAEEIAEGTAAATVLAASVSASLDFNDHDSAREYLKSLGANPTIEAAAVYDDKGEIFATYIRPEQDDMSVPEKLGADGAIFKGQHLTAVLPVTAGGRAVGKVYIRKHIDATTTRFGRYAAILLSIGALSLAIVLPISFRMHKIISNPIEELAARNAIIKTTLDSVEHGVVVSDSETNITFMNERATEMLRVLLSGQIQIGAKLEDLLQNLPAKDAAEERYRGLELQRLRSGESTRGSYVLRDGRTIEYRQAPLPQGGFVRTFTDVSEEKARQQQLEVAKEKAENAAVAKSQFLAAMSHEIRTPMNGVIGIVELLRTTQLSDEQKKMVEIIRNSGVSLLDVINDILDYSKIEAGRMTVEKVEFSLVEVIETTAGVVGGHTSSKFIDITCFVDPALDHVLIGDPVRIRQVVLNLMGNAVKFTQTGVVSIEATIQTKTDDQMVVMVEVTDTGMGIPPEKQQQLFQPFTQADYSTTRKFGGTGLGLSISRNLTELMGGKIGVRSEVGKGSTFWFTLPLGRLAPARRRVLFTEEGVAFSGLRVLVYDDVISRAPVATYMRSVGVTVIEARDVTEVMRELEGSRGFGRLPDLMILSVRLGDDRVPRLLEELRSRPDLRSVRAVLVVPHLSAASAKISTTPVVAATVTAPIQRAQLYDAVAQASGRISRRAVDKDDVSFVQWAAPSINDAISRNCLILVAEDNQTNQFVIRSQLEKLGFAAEFVSDGQEAWNTLERQPKRYALLLTDCHMPFIDGYRLTGMIRDRELGTSGHMPVIALTANAQPDEAEICRAAGMDAHLYKPTNLQTLDATIKKWLPAAGLARRPTDGAPVANLNGAQPTAAAWKAATGIIPMPKAAGTSQAVTSVVNALDMEVLSSLIGSSDPELLREVMVMYLENESKSPAKISALVAQQDAVALVQAAHSAKGAAASLGATWLADLCKRIEHGAPQQDWAAMRALSDEIAVAFEEVRSFIENQNVHAGEGMDAGVTEKNYGAGARA